MIKKDTPPKIKPSIKPVSFTQNNETDVLILKYIEDNNLAFSSYVKDLITTDMRKSKDKNEIADAINNLTNIITNAISNNSLNIINNTEDRINDVDKNNTADQEKKTIIGNILNMSK